MESHSGLPAWGLDELPAPPAFNLRNAFRVIGPGAILLVGGIGGGEWLVGPAVGVQFGARLFWIATVAIVLQSLFNMEGIRYTLYTGEPILSGIMRLRPSSKLWGGAYVAATAAQLGLPSVAGGCAAVLFASFAGRTPQTGDEGGVTVLSYGVIVGTALILLGGKTIEKMLERLSWAMIVLIFTFLLAINVAFVPFDVWRATFAGFFSFGHLPEGVNLPLLGALAATAGSGGVANLAVSNWARDKGFGMGATTGAIAGAAGRKQVQLSPTGKVFRVNDESLSRWRIWWRYVVADQGWLWGGGAFLGMFLNVNLAMGIMPAGADLTEIGAGAFQAEYLSAVWSGFWLLALLNGFWVLFSTQIGNTDVLVRSITDILWIGSPAVRENRKGDVSKLYYLLLAIFTVWALIVSNWGQAMALMTLMGNIAGLVLAVSSLQILRVNTRLLPTALQPPLWRKVALVGCSLFYFGVFFTVLWDQIQS